MLPFVYIRDALYRARWVPHFYQPIDPEILLEKAQLLQYVLYESGSRLRKIHFKHAARTSCHELHNYPWPQRETSKIFKYTNISKLFAIMCKTDSSACSRYLHIHKLNPDASMYKITKRCGISIQKCKSYLQTVKWVTFISFWDWFVVPTPCGSQLLPPGGIPWRPPAPQRKMRCPRKSNQTNY